MHAIAWKRLGLQSLISKQADLMFDMNPHRTIGFHISHLWSDGTNQCHVASFTFSRCTWAAVLWMKAILPANDASLAQNQTITYCCNLVGKLLGINLLLTDLQILPLLPKSNLACLILVKLEDIHAMPLSKKKLQIICLTIIINFTYVFTFRNSYCISIFIVYC